MLNQILTTYLRLVIILKYSEAARIFCYLPVPFDSHQSIFHVFTEVLAQEGHQIVVLTTLPRKVPIVNITEIDVHEISYSAWEKGYYEIAKRRNTFGLREPLQFWKMVGEIMNPVFDLQLNHPQMQALIKDEAQKFDLILVEAGTPIGIALRARFEAPVLMVSSMTGSNEVLRLIGAEINHYFYPDYTFAPVWDFPFWKKLCSFYHYIRTISFDREVEIFQNAFLKKHLGQQVPSIKELKKDVQMVFLNVHRFWDNNRPVPIGSVLYMGALHLKPPKNLPEDLETFVDNSKNGVVIVSLGSKLKPSTLPPRILGVMSAVFSQLPYDFVWKYDTEELLNKPHNVRLEKWLPQNDLLHHPKVRAFITHGGLQSTDEAIAARVPLVGLPVFLDQWLNTQQYEEYGIGIRLDIDYLKVEDFRNAIIAVMEDRKYLENIDRLSRIASDRQEDSLQTAARWTRHLATRGTHRLIRSPHADTTFVTFFMLDLLLIAAFCVVVVVFSVKRLLGIVWMSIWNR